MARTAFTAPAHIVLQRSPGVFNPYTSSVSPDAAPSLMYGGSSLMDPRLAYNKFNGLGNGALAAIVGWAGASWVPILDYTPPAASTTNIAAAANAVSGTPMTLVSSSGAGVVVTSSALTTFPSGTVIPSGTLAMGTQMGYIILGQRDQTAFYDPTKAWTCVIQITGVASGTGGAFSVVGYDVYGQPMHETITATAGATSTNGKKAWKWITSITPQFADAHTYSVGTTLITGLNLAMDSTGYTQVWVSGSTWGGAVTAAVATTATATTGDVRGTTLLTNAATVVVGTLSAARLTTVPIVQGMFGVQQF